MSIGAGKQVIKSFCEDFKLGYDKQEFHDVSQLLSRLDAIQEQPHLLDEFLPELTLPIVAVLEETLAPAPLPSFIADLYHILYYYSKIRGSKVIVKFLPNHAHLLTAVVDCLGAQPLDDHKTWHVRYILLLWLSLICMVPFDLSSFDTDGRIPTVDQIMDLANAHITASSREREAAGLLIARLITRKDVFAVYLPNFLGESIQMWQTHQVSLNHRTGVLTCLCEIYKIANRDVLKDHTGIVASFLEQIDQSQNLANNTLLRKLRVKLAQRLVLALLKPTQASWRYKSNVDHSPLEPDLRTEDYIHEASTLVENVLGHLIETLSDQDTIVRYSAAKGLGRITSRLDMTSAEEIITAITGILQEDIISESRRSVLKDIARESTWHGCCLALAELCRNGALLPAFLTEVLDLVFIAIKFDIKKGSHSVGTSVRDAACYVVWSILRCYHSSILAPHCRKIATSLIVVAVFDREVSVRRAASAAYQEGVGRHQNDLFPDGIAVLSKADFFAVGQKRMSFLEVAPAVFQHVEYQSAIVDYLIFTSSRHWDRELRELAGKSLSLIMTSPTVTLHDDDPTSILFEEGIAVLRYRMASLDATARHGAYYFVGEIALAVITNKSSGHEMKDKWTKVLIDTIATIPQYNFKGPTSAIMYSAVCHCIKYMVALSSTSEDSRILLEPSLQAYMQIAINGLSIVDEAVRAEATDAMRNLCMFSSIYSSIEARVASIAKLGGPAKKGWLTFYGKLCLPAQSTLNKFVFPQLLASATIQGNSLRDDAELRQISTRSIGKLIPQVMTIELTSLLLTDVFRCLKANLTDYTIDARGDIGSWVREAAICSSCQLLSLVDKSLVIEHQTQLMGLLLLTLAQGLSKIDNLRCLAIVELSSALLRVMEACKSSANAFVTTCELMLPVIQGAAHSIDMGSPSTCIFDRLVELIDHNILRRSILTEYLISGSSGSQSTRKAASDALARFLDEKSANNGYDILTDIIDIVSSAKDNDRVLIPVLDSTAALFEAQVLNESFDKSEELFTAIQISTIGSRTMTKVMAGLRCYAALTCTEHNVRHKAWKKLCLALDHKFPRIRAYAAELLYTVLSNLDLETSEDLRPLVATLSQNDWIHTTLKEIHEQCDAIRPEKLYTLLP